MKNFIYCTAFFSGMAIMAVEISATRLLAPYFGASMVIWTIIIGMIMIALSLGNYFGGRAADKYHSLDPLFTRIWIAALWIGLIPLVGKYIITAIVIVIAFLLPDHLLVTGTVFSALIIFTLPLILLGMTSPFLIKMGTKDPDHYGRTTGKIQALSTIGSIIGTFIPTFITIPATGIGTSKTFLIFALLLNLLCLYYFIKVRKKLMGKRTIVKTRIMTISLLIVLCLLFSPLNFSFAYWKEVVLEDESQYNYLQVYRDQETNILTTNVAMGIQSVYKEGDPLSGLYYDYLLTAPLFHRINCFEGKLDVLILGLGAGTFAKECRYFFPNSQIDGVEIDPKIIKIAKERFGLTDEDARVFIGDGRAFLLTKEAKQYDVIIIDAYRDVTMPFHMVTQEFFREVKHHLKPNGIIGINMVLISEKNTRIIDYLSQTVKSQMTKVYRCDLLPSPNTIIIASDNPYCRDVFLNNLSYMDSSHLLTGITGFVKNHLGEVVTDKLVFMDEVAPVELMGEQVLDEYVSGSIKPRFGK